MFYVNFTAYVNFYIRENKFQMDACVYLWLVVGSDV